MTRLYQKYRAWFFAVIVATIVWILCMIGGASALMTDKDDFSDSAQAGNVKVEVSVSDVENYPFHGDVTSEGG